MAAQKIVRCAVVALLFLASADGSAQAPDPSSLSEAQRDELGRLFRVAQSAFEAENYLEAVGALKSAHEIFPEPNILYRIGDAYERLGDLRRAASYYRAYVEVASDAQDAELVGRRAADLDRRAAALQQEIGQEETRRAALLLDTNPAGATVYLDATKLSDTTPTRVEVVPGAHQIKVELPGYESLQREVVIEQGETISLVYALQREAIVAPATRSTAPWLLVGAGGVATATGGGLLIGALLADTKIRNWDQERADQHAAGGAVDPRPDAYDATYKRRAMFTTTGAIVGSVGVVAIATGIVWLVARGRSERHVSATADGIALRF